MGPAGGPGPRRAFLHPKPANPGGGTGGTCFGESGGPVLKAGTGTVLAVNSYVTNGNCKGVTYSSRVDIPDVLNWIYGFLGA